MDGQINIDKYISYIEQIERLIIDFEERLTDDHITDTYTYTYTQYKYMYDEHTHTQVGNHEQVNTDR